MASVASKTAAKLPPDFFSTTTSPDDTRPQGAIFFREDLDSMVLLPSNTRLRYGSTITARCTCTGVSMVSFRVQKVFPCAVTLCPMAAINASNICTCFLRMAFSRNQACVLPLRFIEKNPAFLCAMCSAHPERAWGAENVRAPCRKVFLPFPKGENFIDLPARSSAPSGSVP